MPFWYNDAVEPSKFASLVRTDWKDVNTSISVEELAIKQDDDFYHLFMYANSATDVINTKGGRDWRFMPQLVTLKIAKKDYKKYDYKSKKQIDVTQSRIEKLFTKLLSNYDEGKVYFGGIALQDNNIADMVISELDPGGKPILPDVLASLSSSFINLEEDLEPTYLSLDELKLPENKSNSARSYSQGEGQKLDDRLAFVLKEVNLVNCDIKATSMADVVRFIMNGKDAAPILQVIEYCSLLIK